MAITRQRKEEVVSKVRDAAKAAETVFFMDTSAVKTTVVNELRRHVKAGGGVMQMLKKRLAKRSFESIDKLHPELFERKGALTMATAKEADAVETAKAIYKLSRANDTLKIIGAIFGTNFLRSKDVVQLAKLPAREVLIGQFVGVLAAPLRGFLHVLNGNSQKLVLALDAIRSKRSGSS